ncbi:hypothetical protein Poly51_04080 [Rubripirellula tenax]|uniref:PEP-CTERM protein-sorting domain-containing protein n=1 Tax=Rubripirellula tenax TaxID=2528015 RepID=A0A5C6FK43_9BACT|nr:PEP-CTERM sorting domain-containing protein [Rubripirellula tenax]TWU60134.1 hypothetical protein Poly51_04080 [Rubripirellula tenax]
MTRHIQAAFLSAALAIAMSATSYAGVVTSVLLDFPTEFSTTRDAINGFGVLGTGSAVHFNLGDYVEQTYGNTGLSNTTGSQWQFSITDFTLDGVLNTFDARINGATVGSFSYTSDGVFGSVHDFDLTYTHAPAINSQIGVMGPDSFFLTLLATSTVPTGSGTWAWNPGGTVTLTGMSSAQAIPEPGSMALLTFATCSLGIAAYRRRKTANGTVC